MIEDFLKALLPVLGPTSVLLLAAVVYQSWQIERARAYRDKMESTWREMLANETVARVNAFNEVAKALLAMHSTITTIADAIERLERRIDK